MLLRGKAFLSKQNQHRVVLPEADIAWITIKSECFFRDKASWVKFFQHQTLSAQIYT
jgi:hypothetical protein